MADYTVTAANVQQSSSAQVQSGIAGATITAGMAVYKDSTDGKIKAADCTVDPAYECIGIAVNNGADGQPIDYCVRDLGFDPGFTAAIGDVVILSTAGLLAPVADLAASDYCVVVGVFTTTSLINMNLNKYTRATTVKA